MVEFSRQGAEGRQVTPDQQGTLVFYSAIMVLLGLLGVVFTFINNGRE